MTRYWREATGLEAQEAHEEARRRSRAREDASEVRERGGFDAEFLLGDSPSYAGERPSADPADGWTRLPRYIGRELDQRIAGAEILRAPDGSRVAYRPRSTTSGD